MYFQFPNFSWRSQSNSVLKAKSCSRPVAPGSAVVLAWFVPSRGRWLSARRSRCSRSGDSPGSCPGTGTCPTPARLWGERGGNGQVTGLGTYQRVGLKRGPEHNKNLRQFQIDFSNVRVFPTVNSSGRHFIVVKID